MSNLAKVFLAKIILTIGAWVIPPLFLPTCLLSCLGFVVPEPIIFLRLLGMAYAALVVGYCFGYQQARKGERPLGVIWVGIVSNGGACLLLVFYAIRGTWSAWGPFAQFVMWVSMVGTGAITTGLVVFGLWRSGKGSSLSN